MKKERLSNIFTVFIFLVIGIVVFLHLVSSRRIIKKQAYSTLKESTIEKAQDIETKIDYALSSIKLVSNFTSGKMTERELKDPNSVFPEFEGNIPFNFIEYIRWDGLNFMNSTAGENPFDASERVYYKKGIQGKTGIWINFSPKAAKEVLMNFYTPLYYNNEISGVLTGVIGGQTGIARELISSFMGNKIKGFLCDENYRVISTSLDEMPYGLNLSNYRETRTISDIIKHVEDADTNPFKYTQNGKEGICCVSKINSTGWNLVLFVFPETLQASMKEISDRLLVSSIISVFLLFAYLSIRIYMNIRSSKKTEATHLNIINALGVVYQNVYVVNIETSELFIYRMSNHIDKRYGQAFPKMSYERGLELYIEKEVLEEDKPLFESISTIPKIKEIFVGKNEYSFIYRAMRDDGMHYFQCSLLKPDEESGEFVACFKNVDEMMAKQIEDQNFKNSMLEMQATQISILSSISGIYLTSHLFDLVNDTFAEFNTSKEVRDVVSDKYNASEQLKQVMKILVMPEYLEKMLAFTDLKTLPKRIKGKKIVSEEFLGNVHGWTRGSFILVESDSNNMPTKVLFVTQVIDDEKRREENLITTANRDGLTGLYNRYAYESELTEFKENEPAENFVYVSFDVNGLKTVNDNLGHEAGDELIRGAADCLNDCFGSYGKVFRTGGDEFQAMIFVDKQELERIKEKFDEMTENWTGKIISELRISAGYVLKFENPELTMNQITKLADQRMYKAKALYYSSMGITRRGQQAAYEILCYSYTKILKVNLTKDEHSIIQMNNEEYDSGKGYSDKISKWLYDFGVSGQVHEDDRKTYLEKTDIEYLRKFFADGNKLWGLQYRRMIGDDYRRVVMEMMPSKDYKADNQELFLYVKDIDEKG